MFEGLPGCQITCAVAVLAAAWWILLIHATDDFVANVWRQRCSADAATGLIKASAGSLGPDQFRSQRQQPAGEQGAPGRFRASAQHTPRSLQPPQASCALLQFDPTLPTSAARAGARPTLLPPARRPCRRPAGQPPPSPCRAACPLVSPLPAHTAPASASKLLAQCTAPTRT